MAKTPRVGPWWVDPLLVAIILGLIALVLWVT